MNAAQIKALMLSIPLFDQLTTEEHAIVAAQVEYQQIKKGTLLIKEGNAGNTLFYLLSGKIEIRKESVDGREAVLTQFSRGSLLGELALLENESRRSATAVALEDCEILSFSRKSFDEIVERYPRIGLVILRGVGIILANRLRATTGRFADILS